jgi:hypothetical protein
MKKKYRSYPFDMMSDIYLLQRRVLWIFWWSMGVGTKKEVETKIEELNANENKTIPKH